MKVRPQPQRPRKALEYAQARELRGEGWSYKRIAAELGVSPSSVLSWTRDIQLTQSQIDANLRLSQMTPEGALKRSKRRAELCRERRMLAQTSGRTAARAGDWLHQAGCMLYWAEGSKDRNALAFVNSDQAMVRFFAAFLRESLELEDDRLTIRLNVYLGNGLTLEQIESRWLTELALPRSCLRGHQLNHFPTSSSGSRVNKLPYGVCTLKVLRSTSIVQHIFGAIQEYGGFEEPTWLG